MQKFTHYDTIGHMYSLINKDFNPIKIMPPGRYRLIDTPMGTFCEPIAFNSDKLLNLPDTTSDKIIKELNKFWDGKTKARFKEFSLLYKRGILMHGKPGTGKTSTIIQISEEVVKNGGYVFYNPKPNTLKAWVDGMRTIQPTPRVLAVYEEFEEWIERDEAEFLQLLDGSIQLDDIVYIATTNYIEDIPARIKNRPSRFATVVEVGFPSAEARKLFFELKLGKYLNNIDLNEWVTKSEGMSIDHLKDLIVSVICFESPLSDSVEKIKTMNTDDYAKDKQDSASFLEDLFERTRRR